MDPLQDAVVRLEETLRQDPERPDLVRQLGIAYAQAGQHDKAVAMLSFALRRAGQDVDLLCALADAYRARQHFEQAARHYRAAAEHDSRSVNAWLGLGSALGELGQRKEALKALRRTARLKAGRNDPRVHRQLGLVYQADKDYLNAVESFAAAIQLGSDDVDLWERLGVVQFRAGLKHEAEQTLTRVLTRDRARPAALHLMGCIAFQRALETGEPTPAREYFQEALALRPDSAEAHYFVGRLDAAQGQFKQAAAHLEQAHRLDPGDPATLVEIGQLLERAGKHDRAHKAYQRARQQAPSRPEPHYYLGRWFEQVGQDRQLSNQHYRRYLELGGRDPDKVRHIEQAAG